MTSLNINLDGVKGSSSLNNPSLKIEDFRKDNATKKNTTALAKQVFSPCARVELPTPASIRKSESTPSSQESMRSSLLDSAILGKEIWHRYFGDIGEEPPITEMMRNALNKYFKTHRLVLIPATVNHRVLTLESLEEFVKNPRNGGNASQYQRGLFDLGQDANASIGKSYWVLIAKNVLEASRGVKSEEQKKLIESYGDRGEEWTWPKALEAAVYNFAEFARSGHRPYGAAPWTYARCEECDQDLWPLIVGGFSSEGLNIFSCIPSSFDCIGIAPAWRFLPP